LSNLVEGYVTTLYRYCGVHIEYMVLNRVEYTSNIRANMNSFVYHQAAGISHPSKIVEDL